jgi:DNA-binding beta-propeller fold protein YncE
LFGIAIDAAGSYALVGDFANHRVRRIDLASLLVTTLAGSSSGYQDGQGTSALFNEPHGVAIDPTGAYALVTEYAGRRVRRVVIATGQVTTLAGTGATSAINGAGAVATFAGAIGIAIDAGGTFALLADSNGNHIIRRIALASPCSQGSYCPSGSSAGVLCTAGAYCGSAGLSVASGACASGFFCPNGSFNARGGVLGQGACRSVTVCRRRGPHSRVRASACAFVRLPCFVNCIPCSAHCFES